MKKLLLLFTLVFMLKMVIGQNLYPGIFKDKIKPCDSNSIEISPTMPIPDSADKYRAVVWPNPSTEEFNVKVDSPSQQVIKIDICDLQGKKISEFEIENRSTVKFGNFYAPGLYIVRVKQGSELRNTFKLIKQ